MNKEITTPPWKTPGQWTEVLWAIRHGAERNKKRLEPSTLLAGKIKKVMLSVSPAIDMLCADSCALCSDICCKKANVWFDFRDLLFLHFSPGTLPSAQLEKRKNSPCSYLTHTGCRLPRSSRPFICTWYLCPDQKKILMANAPPLDYNTLASQLDRIKTLRKQLESEFITAVS